MGALFSNKKARLGLAILAAFWAMALFGPLFVVDPKALVDIPHSPPSAAHWLGTTGQGRDVLSQVVVGSRVSLAVGFAVGAAVTALATAIGVTAAYFRGVVDDVLSLATNLFLLLPGLPLMVVLAAYLPPGPVTIFAVLTVTGWAWNARVFRSQALSVAQRDFVAAAVVGGHGSLYIVFFEMLPNLVPVIAAGFIQASVYAIGAQVGLEFIGLGDPSLVTWGTNLYWASNDAALLTGSWWTYVPTGCAIAAVGLGLALVNFGIDEAANPRLTVPRRFWQAVGRRGEAFATPVLPSR